MEIPKSREELHVAYKQKLKVILLQFALDLEVYEDECLKKGKEVKLVTFTKKWVDQSIRPIDPNWRP